MPATMPKMMAAALTAVVLAVGAAPAWSAETATPNDTARFLAGLPPSADSPLAALTKDAAWQQHARYFDSIFAREDSATSRRFAPSPRTILTEKHDTMLYMFSGPDFLYATSFFPERLDLCYGRPRAGRRHSAIDQSQPRGRLRHRCEISKSRWRSLLSYSFFITNNMKTQLHEGPVYGTLPVLYVFMARTGKTIHDVSLVSLDTDGNFIKPDEPTARATAKRSGAQRRPQRRARREDRLLGRQRPEADALLFQHQPRPTAPSSEAASWHSATSSAPADSFIKSASYLLHSRRLQQGAQFPARSQRDDPPGRQRHPARLFQSEEMAAAAVRPLCRPALDLRKPLPSAHG